MGQILSLSKTSKRNTPAANARLRLTTGQLTGRLTGRERLDVFDHLQTSLLETFVHPTMIRNECVLFCCEFRDLALTDSLSIETTHLAHREHMMILVEQFKQTLAYHHAQLTPTQQTWIHQLIQ